MRLNYIGGPIVALVALFASGARAQDSCATMAQGPAERTICGSAHLIWEDRELNALYRLAGKLAPSSSPGLRLEQRRWLVEVRDHCSTVDCLNAAYGARNDTLRRYVNSDSDPMPPASSWQALDQSSGCKDGYRDFFTTDFVMSPGGQFVGIWEASTFCGNFINGGLIDVRARGNLLEVRVLGGRGPSHTAGVALVARRKGSLFIENMFERSSIGAQGDYEFFHDVALVGGATTLAKAGNDYGETTQESLDEAWRQTIDAAKDEGSCPAGQPIEVCIRKAEP